MEDRSFRKRQNMLSDIQAMIVDYKKKSHYSNLVTNHDDEYQEQMIQPILTEQRTEEAPRSRLAQTSHSNQIFNGTNEMQVP